MKGREFDLISKPEKYVGHPKAKHIPLKLCLLKKTIKYFFFQFIGVMSQLAIKKEHKYSLRYLELANCKNVCNKGDY